MTDRQVIEEISQILEEASGAVNERDRKQLEQIARAQLATPEPPIFTANPEANRRLAAIEAAAEPVRRWLKIYQPESATHLRALLDAIGKPDKPSVLPASAPPEMAIAELIAILAHYGQTTESEGMNYILHPAAVAASVAEEYKAIAWLHDVLEDSDFTEGHLLAAGIRQATADAVKIVTRRGAAEPYAQFIDRIAASGNLAAITVKIVDIEHNLRPGCPESLAKRYRAALPRLEEALDKLRVAGEKP